MTSILGRIWSRRPAAAAAVAAEPSPYEHAMAVSNELIERMRAYSNGRDAARGIMADVWAQNHNVPFLTTVHEAVEEAKSPLAQDPHARISSPPTPEDNDD